MTQLATLILALNAAGVPTIMNMKGSPTDCTNLELTVLDTTIIAGLPSTLILAAINDDAVLAFLRTNIDSETVGTTVYMCDLDSDGVTVYMPQAQVDQIEDALLVTINPRGDILDLTMSVADLAQAKARAGLKTTVGLELRTSNGAVTGLLPMKDAKLGMAVDIVRVGKTSFGLWTAGGKVEIAQISGDPQMGYDVIGKIVTAKARQLADAA